MTYSIETQYYEHDGGTKFYEIVLIEEKDGPALLLKRFGKLSEKIAGGQVQSTRGSVGVCRNDRQKVAEAKLKGKSGQGKYERASAPHYGLHKFGGTAVDAARLHKLIEEHYAVKNVGSIYNYFGISHDGAIDDVSDTTPLGVPADESAPEPRDNSWGTW